MAGGRRTSRRGTGRSSGTISLPYNKLLIKAFKSRSRGVHPAATILQPSRTARAEVGIQNQDGERSLLPALPYSSTGQAGASLVGNLPYVGLALEQRGVNRPERGSTEASAEVQGPPSWSKPDRLWKRP